MWSANNHFIAPMVSYTTTVWLWCLAWSHTPWYCACLSYKTTTYNMHHVAASVTEPTINTMGQDCSLSSIVHHHNTTLNTLSHFLPV
ncbi:hypothetical protein E2C01_043492 [Portunus trituberculatus]|uniref:Uncharacterized protein n=1 Tax=Portunus trituberculatus TaxID=210409 RepID=A0A5B7FQF7_PORTR|nr:hypothetical protein [Portunus trituberculatus]